MSVKDWPVFVIVDSHEQGGFDFVEIEDGEGQSISVEHNPQPDGLIAIGPLYRDPPEPTHYAVIDIDGDMLAAFYKESYPSAKAAENRAKEYISEAREKYPHAYEWTVKGVTVHD